jgi:hypothetical protein
MKKKQHWFRKAWQEKGFRIMSYSILIGAIVFQLLIYWADRYIPVDYAVSPPDFFPEVAIFGWGLYILVVLPITYFYNKKGSI